MAKLRQTICKQFANIKRCPWASQLAGTNLSKPINQTNQYNIFLNGSRRNVPAATDAL